MTGSERSGYISIPMSSVAPRIFPKPKASPVGAFPTCWGPRPG